MGWSSPFKPWGSSSCHSHPMAEKELLQPCYPSTSCSPCAGDPALCPPSQVTWFCSLPPSQGNSWVASDMMGMLLSSCPTTSSPFFKALSCVLAASVLPFPLYCTCLCLRAMDCWAEFCSNSMFWLSLVLSWGYAQFDRLLLAATGSGTSLGWIPCHSANQPSR